MILEHVPLGGVLRRTECLLRATVELAENILELVKEYHVRSTITSNTFLPLRCLVINNLGQAYAICGEALF